MTTTTVYPDASTGGTTVDGRVNRGGVSEDFGTIRAGAGTSANATLAAIQSPSLTADTTTDRYTTLIRSIWTFDTSSVPANDTIGSAVLSLRGTNKASGFTAEPDIDIVNASPAADNNLAASDYGNVGTTVYGSVAYGSWNTGGYNDISLDTAAITKAGITKLGSRLSWDTDNNFTGTWASGGVTHVASYYADQTGTTNDPKLVVLHAATAPKMFTYYQRMRA